MSTCTLSYAYIRVGTSSSSLLLIYRARFQYSILSPISSITCELIGASGEVIESRRLYEELLQRPGGPYTQYFGTLPWDPSVKAIALFRAGDELYRHRLEDAAPRVQLSTAELRRQKGERVHIEWTGDVAGDRPITYIPRYSNDDGKTWRALEPPQAQASYVLDLSALPGGEHCRFQVVASSGIRTTVITSEPFTVPVKPTTGEILSPVDGAEIRVGARLLLHGRAFSPDFGTTSIRGDAVVLRSRRVDRRWS